MRANSQAIETEKNERNEETMGTVHAIYFKVFYVSMLFVLVSSSSLISFHFFGWHFEQSSVYVHECWKMWTIFARRRIDKRRYSK